MIGRRFGQQKIGTKAYAMAAAIITMSSPLWCGGASAVETPSLPMATSTTTVTNGQEFFAGASYAGSESCKQCHEKVLVPVQLHKSKLQKLIKTILDLLLIYAWWHLHIVLKV